MLRHKNHGKETVLRLEDMGSELISTSASGAMADMQTLSGSLDPENG